MLGLWITIGLGIVLVYVGIFTHIANLRYLRDNFDFNYVYLTITAISVITGGLMTLVGIALLVVEAMK